MIDFPCPRRLHSDKYMVTTAAKFSRRSLLHTAGLAAGLGMVRSMEGQSAKARRVLALVGDRYHNPDYIRVALTKMFDGQGVTVDYTMNYRELSRDLLKNYQLFLCLRDGMIWPDGYLGPDAYTAYEQGLENKDAFPEPKPQSWLTEEQALALKEFVTGGNGFYSLHNNSHVSLSSKTYRDVQGGAYIGHPTLQSAGRQFKPPHHARNQGLHRERRAALRGVRQRPQIHPSRSRKY
ncbi:MAG: hypothetical protein ACJ73N_08830 [Bryobacteraceae bacterium]